MTTLNPKKRNLIPKNPIMKLRIISCFIFALFLFSGCTLFDGSGQAKVIGGANEVLVVCEQNIWNGPGGDSIRSVLNSPMLGLPQIEPSFDIVHRTPTGFKGSYTSHRNVLLVNIDPDANNGMSVRHNLWADSQVVVQLFAKDNNDILTILGKDHEALSNLLIKAERARMSDIYKKSKDLSIARAIENQFGINIDIPRGWVLDKREKGFVWLTMEERKATSHLMIWEYPYISESQLSPQSLINIRDSIAAINVPGANEGSYMTTEKEFIPTYTEESYNNNYIAKLQGLWKMHNYIMGGPFVQISTVDTKTNRIITVEGFVFAPSTEKRNYVRRLEAILYSLSLEKENPDNENEISAL